MASKYSVHFSDLGVKQLKKLAHVDAIRVIKKVKILEKYPVENNNIKRLKGIKAPIYRLRIGTIRAIFEVDVEAKIIWILAVGYRGDVYKKY